MEAKSKAEKRAAGRMLLQQYQRKHKDGKSSPSHSQHENEYKDDKKTIENGHTGNDTNEISNNYFTFQKADSPSEQFFDNFRSTSQHTTPEHLDNKFDGHEMSPLASFKENERIYEYSSSSRSSRSEDEGVKKIIKNQLTTDNIVKEELNKQIIDSNEKVIMLENEIQKMKQEIIDLKNQQMPLEKKVELHLKTIEILVSEKSELQQELNTIREQFNSDKNKFDELNAKLKVSQEQVGQFQNELSETYEAREQHNTILKKLEHSLVEMNNKAESYWQESIISKDEINNLKQKLEQMTFNNQDLMKNMNDKDKQLSMAEMRLAQLGGGGIPTKDDINSLGELEKECNKLKTEIKENEEKFLKEKFEISSEYQQYIDTLNSQMKLLNQQYESCLITNNNLAMREESLVKHISELEKKVQRDHQAGPSLSESNSKLNQELKEANSKIVELNTSLDEKNEEIIRLNAVLDETSTRLSEVELSLERLEIPDARKLQAAIENDKVAATRAVQQNTQLKQHVVELQEAVVRLNNEKLELTERWQHSEHIVTGLNRELNKFKNKMDVVYRDAVAQCTVVFHANHSTQVDIDDFDGIEIAIEHVTPEALSLLERKLKKTMNDYADLYDEKQRLEHLVLHLQSETETIGEYVTLYQNQRSLLQERAKERDRQMDALSKEKEELRFKLAQISSLLPQVITNNESSPTEVINGVELEEGPSFKIKTLLTQIENSSIMKDNSHIEVKNNFHPCLLCSGKLINI